MKKALTLPLFTALITFLVTYSPSARAAGYETIVTDSSFSTSSRVVIDEEQIKKAKAPSVTSLLQTQANISISNSTLQPGAIFLRGGDASHVLIMIDGVPMYDSTTVQRTFNLNSLNVRSVRRIEIIKGSQSVLYGGQALTGVIKIETFPLSLQTKSSGQVSGGSNNLQQFSMGHLQSLDEDTAILANLGSTNKNNRSPLPDSDFRYPSRVQNADLAYVHRDSLETIIKAFGTSDVTEVAGSDPMGSYFGPLDTKDFKVTNEQAGASVIVRQKQGALRPQLSLNYQNSYRAFVQPVNSLNTVESDEKYGGNQVNIRGEVAYLQPDYRVDTGLSYTREYIFNRSLGVEKSNQAQELKGLFIKGSYSLTNDLNLEAGLRGDVLNKNAIEGSADLTNTYQAGVSYRKLSKLEYSTGFKSPSLFQLVGSYGNPGLLPEKSSTLSFTQEIPAGEQQALSFTVFETRFKDLIATKSGGSPPKTTYQNVSEAKTQGVEADYSAHPTESTSLHLALGYQEPKDLTTNTWLTRRPLQTGSARVSQAWNDKHWTNLEAFGNGERRDQISRAAGPGTITDYRNLSSYIVWNASYGYTYSENLSAFARANNLFNNRYEETMGYLNEGTSLQVGLEFTN